MKIVLKYKTKDHEYEDQMFVGQYTRANIDDAISFPNKEAAENHRKFTYMETEVKTIRVSYEELS
jgi:hypothetical protein